MGFLKKLFSKNAEENTAQKTAETPKKDIRALPKKYRGMEAGNINIEFLYNYMWIIGNVAVNVVKDEIPREGLKEGTGLHFKVKGTNNYGFLRVENSSKESKKFIFKVGCYRQNTDRLYSNYMFEGTYDELLEYLMSDNARETWFEQLVHLSHKVDDYN